MISIRPYQVEALDFLVERRRAALFDEPGLGKTMQALLAMDDLVPDGRTLVVCTGDAVGVWQDEIHFWLDQEVTVVAGPGAKWEGTEEDGGWFVTNYHRVGEALAQGGWDGVIFDESQALRNRNTRTLFAAVRQHFDRGRTGLGSVPAFFLSGTPIVKAAGDVWPILHLIDKRRWSSYWRFVQQYAVTWQDQYGWHVEGVTNATALWQELSSVCLRRTVREVQPNLPAKVRQRIPLRLTAKQAKAYRQLEQDMVAELDTYPVAGLTGTLLLAPSVLALETRLRQLLASPRLLGVDDDGAAVLALKEIAETNARPFVVFTPFPSAIPYMAAALLRSGRPTYTVRGGMGDGLRQSVAAFRRAAKAGEAPILFASVAMAKSWSVADVTHECYMLEFDWNETTMVQAESRLHRNEQKDTVFSRYFVHEETHDYDALDVLAGKRRLADVILDRARRRLK